MKNNTNLNFALFIINFNSFWGSFKLCLLSWKRLFSCTRYSTSLSSIKISSFKADTQGKPLDLLTNTVRNCKLIHIKIKHSK